MNFGFNDNITLVHNTYIYVMAIATNAAGLRGISYSDPILVDLTPPNQSTKCTSMSIVHIKII